MASSKVVEQISTVFELEQLNRAIEALLAALYKTDEAVFETTFREVVPLHVSQALRQELVGEREAKADHLRGLKQELVALPVVRLTMAFYPSEGFLAELVGRMREMMGTAVIVDVKVRRLLLGGARVEFEGRFKDNSVKARLTEILDSQEEKMAEWGKIDG